MSQEYQRNMQTLRNRMGNSADAMLLQVVANGGKTEMDDKAAAALDRFASQAQAPNREVAIDFVNGLVENVFTQAEAAIAARFPDVAPDKVTDFIMQECDHNVRTSIFTGLFYGRKSVIGEMVERFKLGNKS